MSLSRSPDTSQSLSPQASRPPDLDDDQKKLYLHHEHVVSAYDGSDILYRDAVLRAKASARSAKQATATADRLRATEQTLTQYVDQLSTQHMRRFLLPRTMREKIHKAQMELKSAVQDRNDAETVANSAQKKALADMKSCMRLREGAHKLRESERTRRQILDGLFDGLHIGTPEENEVESQRDVLVLATNRKRDALTAQRQAYQLLASALVDLKQAKKELWEARITNTVDLFNGGGVGFVAGMQSRILFNAATDKSKEAATKISQALALNPKLPIRKMVKSKSKENAPFGMGDLFFDGLVTDMLARMAIEKAEDAIEVLEQECEASIALQKNIVTQLREEYATSSAELEKTSKELVRIRVDLIHDALL